MKNARCKLPAVKPPKKFYGWWSDKLSKRVPIINGTNLEGKPVDAVAMTNRSMSIAKMRAHLKEWLGVDCDDLVPLGRFLPPGVKE